MTNDQKPRTFSVVRDTDVSGVSGTGTVADGCEFPDGTTVLRWRELPEDAPNCQRGVRATTVVLPSVAAVRALHGHNGATRIVWLQDESLVEVHDELGRQDAKWGQQNHPDGTGGEEWSWDAIASLIENRSVDNDAAAGAAKRHTDTKAEFGMVTWADILLEEVAEAFAEDDPARLRAELVQVAAVAAQWVAAIDRRSHGQVDVP